MTVIQSLIVQLDKCLWCSCYFRVFQQFSYYKTNSCSNLNYNLRYSDKHCCSSYWFEDERGIFPGIQFIMDLELPADFVPINADGEQQSFELIPVEKVKYK